MSARVEEGLGEGVLAVCNGTKFRLNDLVDVIVGTGIGVPVATRAGTAGYCYYRSSTVTFYRYTIV